MPFSGKSEAVRIAKQKDIPVIRMGDLVWEEVKKRDLKLIDKNVGFVANEMRQKHGKNIWAKKTIKKIKKLSIGESIVIDGVRNIEEIDIFKKELGDNFILVAIQASDEKRYSRAMNRNREDDSKNIDKIKERDKRELSWGLDGLIATADIVIKNEKSLDVFRNKINNILLDL